MFLHTSSDFTSYSGANWLFLASKSLISPQGSALISATQRAVLRKAAASSAMQCQNEGVFSRYISEYSGKIEGEACTNKKTFLIFAMLFAFVAF